MNKKIAFRQLLNRLTGFSTPVFGVSWSPAESEKQVAERVITFLEDRRVILPRSVLDNFLVFVSVASPSAYDTDTLSPVTDSIIEIRHFLTKQMQQLPRDSDLFKRLDGMRSVCRHSSGCLNRMSFRELEWELLPRLVEFKTLMCIHITAIAVSYGIDVSEELADMLPLGKSLI